MNEAPLRINPQLAWREIDGQVFVISPLESMVHEMNGTASFIWKQVDSGHRASEIARQLESEYGIAEAHALEDTREFLATLQEKGLLSHGPAGAATNA